ncbi:uncharacterized protein LOC133196090 [Saccostrea echinata]|uniref:uncharacterized protein LOC133196090 n=1 Tax=Saccostrea echinata TaxID=191078 RepID=UPI002A81E055|nr:uncharacterized protein LOC133196090 [Saccostrea echinata]
MCELSNDDLLFMLDERIIDQEELFILWSSFNCRSPQLAPDGPRLNFDALTDEQSFSMFRFGKDDVLRLRTTLGIPEKIICKNKSVSSSLEALCILLRRLAYPNRLADLVPIFGRSEPEMSLIFNSTLDFIYKVHGDKLTSLNQRWIQRDLQTLMNSVDRLCPLQNCWGFIDGTLRPVSRPSQYQETIYSGHKRIHGLKFQSVMAPNGLIANLSGPYEGKRHDAGIFRESNLANDLLRNMNSPNGEPFCLYGDAAYPINQHLLGPFKGINLTVT